MTAHAPSGDEFAALHDAHPAATVSLLEIATRAVCKDLGFQPDQWRNFAHLAQTAFDAIAEHLPHDVRQLFTEEAK